MPPLENRVASTLGEIRPREEFMAELLADLRSNRNRLHGLDGLGDRVWNRWLVAGAIAGVVSATGAVMWGARRHHHRRGAA